MKQSLKRLKDLKPTRKWDKLLNISLYGIKRYRILSDQRRIHDPDLYDNILAVCAELWNLYLAN